MKKLSNLSIILILSVTNIFGDTKIDIAVCAAKNSDAERLICYDNLAKKLNVDKPKKIVSKGKGKWELSEQTSPIDDSKKVILMLDAENSILAGYQRNTPSLILRCSENTTNAYINIGAFLGSDGISVLTRFDKDKAHTKYWSISTDNKAIFSPNNILFIKNLLKHDKLLIQLTPCGESPIMTTFDLRGLNDVISPLREACHW